MRILITGGAGSIGSNLVQKLIKNKNYEIFVVDNLWRGKLDYLYVDNKSIINLNKNFYKLDLCDYNNCKKVTKNIDFVIHLADVVSGINFVFQNEPFVFRQNILINSNILSASINNQVKKIIYVGTACSYPYEKQNKINSKPLKENEAYPANPESSYGWSKLMGEYEIELATKYKLINSSILRLHNVYGPPANIDPNKSQVIPAICRKIIEADKGIINIWGSGNQRRTFVYIDDVVDALILSIKKGINKGPIQIGNFKSVSIKSIAKKLVSISGKNIKINYDKTKPEGDKDRTPDLTRARTILKWKPETEIDEGLEKTYSWVYDKINK